jgi:hypothetical protein
MESYHELLLVDGQSVDYGSSWTVRIRVSMAFTPTLDMVAYAGRNSRLRRGRG